MPPLNLLKCTYLGFPKYWFFCLLFLLLLLGLFWELYSLFSPWGPGLVVVEHSMAESRSWYKARRTLYLVGFCDTETAGSLLRHLWEASHLSTLLLSPVYLHTPSLKGGKIPAAPSVPFLIFLGLRKPCNTHVTPKLQ